MEWLEVRATTVESAKEQALVHLGVDESDAEFEVLSEGRMGLFGRIKQEARVRARVLPTPVRPKDGRSRGHNSRKSGSSRRSESSRASSEPTPEPTARSRRKDSSGSKPKQSASAENGARDKPQAESHKARDTKEDAKTMTIDQNRGPSLLEQADLAESFVQGITESLGIVVAFKRHDLENGILRIEANGDGIGILIGRRGGTAQAIDELVRTVLQRSGGTTREGKIRMDMGGVRARRASALAEFTRKVAEESIETRSDIALEPMNRMDRKIVHDVISTMSNVESRSEGEDPHRRVIIAALPD
ncbi:MAG: KH domain-containing protein [Acidimicrobiaceae bacterium]|nr:KH domain-containing protein [Acidimicrobiaceae bacterium]MYE08342.1 KH domain-containing protein [Acidimicrobiaceae bacterium]MYI35304.1 KH domain-containing protein [Acidimicrobiaceae bacterium]